MQDMCGRYQFTAGQWEEIRQIVQAIQRRYGDNAWQPGEIRPTASAPVLLGRGPELMRWGYQLPNTLVINARAETAEEKPLFRESIAMRRCVIPSTGFYEWDREKRKHLFHLPGEQVLYMAGLYEKREGENRYCILTTAANHSMSIPPWPPSTTGCPWCFAGSRWIPGCGNPRKHLYCSTLFPRNWM